MDLSDLLCRLHAGMVRCYPKAVRESFGREMRAVFREVLVNARAAGRLAAMVVMLRELFDWPLEALTAHLDTLVIQHMRPRRDRSSAAIPFAGLRDGRRGPMFESPLTKMEGRGALLAALPPLLLGAGIMGSALIRTDVWYRLPPRQLYLSAAVPLAAGLVVVVGGVLALGRRIPAWGVTWVGTAFMGSLLFVKATVEEGTEEGWLSLAPGSQTAIGLAFLLAGGLLLFLVAKRGWEHAALFTVAAAATMGLSLLQSVTAAPFNRDDLAVLAGPMGLIFGLLLYLYIRRPGLPRVAAVIAAGLLNAGIVQVTTNALANWFVRRGSPSPLLPLLVIITGLLLAGPLTGALLNFRRQP